MIPTQAIDKSYLAKEKIVLPVTGKKVPIPSKVALTIRANYGPTTGVIQFHQEVMLRLCKGVQVPPYTL
jgi:hypothetical protein